MWLWMFWMSVHSPSKLYITYGIYCCGVKGTDYQIFACMPIVSLKQVIVILVSNLWLISSRCCVTAGVLLSVCNFYSLTWVFVLASFFYLVQQVPRNIVWLALLSCNSWVLFFFFINKWSLFPTVSMFFPQHIWHILPLFSASNSWGSGRSSAV